MKRKVSHFKVNHIYQGLTEFTLIFKQNSNIVFSTDSIESQLIYELLSQNESIEFDDHNKLLLVSKQSVGITESGSPYSNFDFDTWLDQRPAIKNCIAWQFEDGIKLYKEWPVTKKEELKNIYLTLINKQSLVLNPIPTLAYIPPSGVETFLDENTAWSYFIAHVGMSLVNEGDQRVPWSMLDMEEEERKTMLHGREFFYRDMGKYFIYHYAFGNATYGNPDLLYRFFIDHQLIGSSPTDTIARVCGWCRRLAHYTGTMTQENVYDHWQYYGLPPVQRIIEGTDKLSTSYTWISHYTAGCWGTYGFLRSILRVINIPVMLKAVGGHALPHFPTINRFLSHGDDLYNGLIRNSEEIPFEAILVDEAIFPIWFPDITDAKNVGKKPVELALSYLPKVILKAYCNDLSSGLNHADGTVFTYFKQHYTLADLENAGLWTRLETKVLSLGGCELIN